MRVRGEEGFFTLLSILKTRSLQDKELVGGWWSVVGVQNLVGANGRSPLQITDKG